MYELEIIDARVHYPSVLLDCLPRKAAFGIGGKPKRFAMPPIEENGSAGRMCPRCANSQRNHRRTDTLRQSCGHILTAARPVEAHRTAATCRAVIAN